jgi:hypothetical protein
MHNLEELDLSISVFGRIVDGNDLKTNIMNHMLQLNKFTFNIRSFSRFSNQVNLPSNDGIQYTFKDFKDNQIISCVDYFPETEKGQCHVYSYPYQLRQYNNLTNNFPGGLFKCVREVSLFDEHPFEHEFFLRIAQSFPLMKKLTIVNRKQQSKKRFIGTKNDNQDLSIIKYSHLIELDLKRIHKDYVTQFLHDRKTCLPNNLDLSVDYRLVKKMTRNFRRNTTRNNCAKLRYINFTWKSPFPEYFKDYFPHANVC